MNQYKHGGVGKGTDPRDMPPGTKIMIVDRRVSAQPNGRRVLHSACATRLARPPAGRTCGVRQAPSPAGFGQTHTRTLQRADGFKPACPRARKNRTVSRRSERRVGRGGGRR